MTSSVCEGSCEVSCGAVSWARAIDRDLARSRRAQFLNTGNDVAARDVCPCVWIVNPTETRQVLKHVLLEALQLKRDALKDPKLKSSPVATQRAPPPDATALPAMDLAY